MASTRPSRPLYSILLLISSTYISTTPSSSRTFRSTSTEKIRLGLEKTLFVIVSQENEHHSRAAQRLRESLKRQAKVLLPTASVAALPSGDGRNLVSALLTHEIDNEGSATLKRRAWTIFPLLPFILKKWGLSNAKSSSTSSSSKSWVFFLQDNTVVDLRQLLLALNQRDPAKHPFLGRPLVDQRPTIIHHYAFHQNVEQFWYPDFASGFFLSMPLIKELVPRWTKEKKDHFDFAIDPKHELAKFIWNDENGLSLQKMDELCGGRNLSTSCATLYNGDIPSCRPTGKQTNDDAADPANEDNGPNSDVADVVVAVKTFSGFHSTRVPVVKSTLEKEILISNEIASSPLTSLLNYFSDVKNDSIPTFDLGVQNTERGHCAKTMAIFQYYASKFSKPFKWLMIVDDDTLLSYRRLIRFLSCYDWTTDIVIGERYGYGLDSEYGYDYPTGGSGMAFSKALVEKLAECECRKADSPDDMHIGMCLSARDIPVLHSPLFHQARPMDYAKDYLRFTQPISFHKHEEHDPVAIWHEYLDAGRDHLNHHHRDDSSATRRRDEL